MVNGIIGKKLGMTHLFAPDGTAVAWRMLLSWPNLAVVATLAIVLPI